MKSNGNLALVPAVLMAVVLLAGCTAKKNESAAPEATSSATPQAAAPEAEHGSGAETLTPAATVPEIWTQIADEQSKLSATIQSGQLANVHHLAFGIRDLVVALAEKANAASPAAASKRNGMVEQVKASATKLDELGDAGNLSGTQAEFAKLEAVLTAMRGVK